MKRRVAAWCLAAVLFTASALPAQTPPSPGAPGPRLLGEPTPRDERFDATRVLGAPTPAAPAAPAGLRGRSGALRVAVLPPGEGLDAFASALGAGAGTTGFRWIPLYGTRTPLLGEPAYVSELQLPATPGVWRLQRRELGEGDDTLDVTVVTQVPHSHKSGGRLNGYHIGSYPTEGSDRADPSDRYAPPAGFIEVTEENQELHLSEHFQIRQFLTKDQHDVWPKYLAVDLRLVDKLELVLRELNAMGIRAEGMHVMSGFRTPQYNGPGGDGRAALSRHMYGDAADVWVDSDGDGWIDDLNGDGQGDYEDLLVMLRAVERVERRHPELVGGAGLYNTTSAHGPFIHIDVRGTAARW